MILEVKGKKRFFSENLFTNFFLKILFSKNVKKKTFFFRVKNEEPDYGFFTLLVFHFYGAKK